MAKTTTRIWLSAAPTSAEIEDLATQLGMEVIELRQIMNFRNEVRAVAERLALEPPQIVAGTMNVLSEIILGCYEPEHRHALISDLIEHLSAWRDGQDDGDDITTEVTH